MSCGVSAPLPSPPLLILLFVWSLVLIFLASNLFLASPPSSFCKEKLGWCGFFFGERRAGLRPESGAEFLLAGWFFARSMCFLSNLLRTLSFPHVFIGLELQVCGL